jgi:hypothetical protein
MVRAGWLATGKMVIYPIRNDVDKDGRQLVNWLPRSRRRSITTTGTGVAASNFIAAFEDWHFDWLDVRRPVGPNRSSNSR